MYNWIQGNIPKDTEKYYWLTVNSTTKTETYPMPCRYDAEMKCWIDANCVKLSVHAVVAHYPILKPKAYTTIGSGCGYYIRTVQAQSMSVEKNESIYGFGLQYANWVGRGYATIEKAKAAVRRLRKIDEQDGYERERYEVIDGDGETVWTFKNSCG